MKLDDTLVSKGLASIFNFFYQFSLQSWALQIDSRFARKEKQWLGSAAARILRLRRYHKPAEYPSFQYRKYVAML